MAEQGTEVVVRLKSEQELKILRAAELQVNLVALAREEFGKGEEELLKTMSDMTNVNQTISAANAKFGFHKVLRNKLYVENSLQNLMHSTNIYTIIAQSQVQEWLPDLEAKQAGKVLQILKCNHSGEVPT